MSLYARTQKAVDQAIRVFSGGFVRTITIVKRGAVSWDEDTKQNVVVTTEYEVDALQFEHTQRSVKKSNNPAIQVGDKGFVVRHKTAPTGLDFGSLTTNDQVQFGGQTYAIKAKQDIVGAATAITIAGG